jgi:hypothetical protein
MSTLGEEHDEGSNDETGQPVLFETKNLVVGADQRIEFGTMSARGPTIACQGTAAQLLPAFFDRRLIQEGQLLVWGRAPEELLRRRVAAYVPLSLPLPAATQVLDAITLSASLVGADRNDARQALGTCKMSGHQKKKLGELSRLQSRLVALAHGLCGSPDVLFIENLFMDLDEAEIEVLETIFDAELADTARICAVDSGSPGSRSLMLRSSEVLVGAGTSVLPPQPPSQVPADGYWVTCSGDSATLAAKLEAAGALVARSPRPSVLLVRRSRGHEIFQAAQEAGTSIVELCPQSSEGISPSRATSGA